MSAVDMSSYLSSWLFQRLLLSTRLIMSPLLANFPPDILQLGSLRMSANILCLDPPNYPYSLIAHATLMLNTSSEFAVCVIELRCRSH